MPKPTSSFVVFAFTIVVGAFVRSVLTAPKPAADTVPPPAPLKTPAELIDI